MEILGIKLRGLKLKGEVSRTLLFLLCVFFVVFLFEKTSSANFSGVDSENESYPGLSLLRELPYFQNYFREVKIIGDIPITAGQSSPLNIRVPGKLKSKKEPNQISEGMIQFITGLIVVYLPEISDAGGLAKEIVRIGNEENIDPLYIAAIISVESRFSVTAKSKVGALGLMQLMPETASEVSKKRTGKKMVRNLTDPETNIILGVSYLKQLEKKYKRNRYYTLAAYNWGLGNVDKSLKGENEIPSSVKKYADTIITRTTRWNKHYSQARKGEKLLLAGK
jgi:hypothetical protein